MRPSVLVCVIALGLTPALAAGAPAPTLPRICFYASFDAGTAADRGAGAPQPREDANLDVLLRRPGRIAAPGVVGRGARISAAPLTYAAAGNVDPEEGTLSLWVQPEWSGSATDAYRVLFSLPEWGMLYKYTDQTYLTFGMRRPGGSWHYGCTADIAAWKPGEWHHAAVTWSRAGDLRRLFLDGERRAEALFAGVHKRPEALILGAGAGGANPARGVLDEVVVLGAPASDDAIRTLYARARAGQPTLPTLARSSATATTPVPAAPGPPPAWVDWSIPARPEVPSAKPALFVDNGLRGALCLNGVWRYQPDPSADAWLYRRVPALGPNFQTFSADHSPLTTRNSPLTAWFDREFTVPDVWRGRRLVLNVGNVGGIARLYLDGAPLGEQLQGDGRSFDLTGKAQPGRTHRLSIRAESIAGDVWLRALPAGLALGDAQITTSVREGSLRVLGVWAMTDDGRRETGDGPTADGPRGPVSGPPSPVLHPHSPRSAVLHAVVAEDEAEKRVVKRFSGPAGELLRLAWPDARRWSPDHPHLYWLHLELRSRGGEVLDRAFPVRFGFREFRIEGGRFLLNEQPIHLRGHSNVPLHRADQVTNDAFVRHYLRVLKAAGLNSFYTMQAYFRGPSTNLERVLSLADEEGILVMPHVSLLGPLRDVWDEPEVREGYRQRVQALVRRYRNHPCIPMWMGETSVADPWDLCPAKLNGLFAWERDLPEAVPIARVVHDVEAAVAAVDSSRPLFHHSAANFGPVQTSMAYLGFDVDLQEREEWPRAWARAPRKPLMVTEFGLPVVLAWHQQKTPAGGLERVYASPPQFVEYAAMYHGDDPYAWEPPECVQAYAKPDAGYLRDHSPAMSRTKALFAAGLRSWRAYGISFQFHAEVISFFPRRRFSLADGGDPRLPGYHPDTGEVEVEDPGPDPRRPTRTPLGEAAYAACRPRLAFIAHPGEDLAQKDHTYRSGETVRKQVILINDTDTRSAVRLRWELRTAAGMRLTGDDVLSYADAGEVGLNRSVIQFVAPEVTARTDFALALTADFDREERVTDTFPFTVFPREQPRRPPGAWLLFDPVGDTARVLKARGIPANTVARPEQLRQSGALLVIGRHALEKPEHLERLRVLGLDAALRAGLRVLVFEQAATNVLGLRLQETSPRHVFPRAAGHPALKGLTPADFHCWRGGSDLIPPWPNPGPRPASRHEYPERFYKWGNTHCVATYVIEKPQVGACRALLDCGFDLMETPLLECAVGRGRILFCQADVTSRWGSDPVATRLAENLLLYLATAEPPRLGAPEPLLPGAANVQWEERAADRGVPPSGPLGWGISRGDLFFRSTLALPAPAGAPPGVHVVALPDGRVASGLDPEKMPDARMQAKARRILAALRLNAGGSAADGPLLAHQGSSDALYPVKWPDWDPYRNWRW